MSISRWARVRANLTQHSEESKVESQKAARHRNKKSARNGCVGDTICVLLTRARRGCCNPKFARAGRGAVLLQGNVNRDAGVLATRTE
jgi:hypothetical protein